MSMREVLKTWTFALLPLGPTVSIAGFPDDWSMPDVPTIFIRKYVS